MSAAILDGKSLSEQIRAEIAQDTAEFVRRTGVTPCLAAVLVGHDAGSEVYVRNKQKACAKAGIESRLNRLPAETTTDEILSLVGGLNRDPAVHGILVQLPLPKGIDESRVLDAVDPLKDVDAFHPENVGRLVQGRPRFRPCTPHGIQQILSRNQIPTAGAEVVVVGRSEIVGKPMALLLLQKEEKGEKGKGDRHLLPERPGGNFAQKAPVTFSPAGDATVTVCHSRTRDLAAVTRRADILIVAIGRPRFITAEMVKPGAVVIDVGMNRLETGLVGDVDFAGVKEVASHITPVPGGVGLLTVAMLLHNTLLAARLQRGEVPNILQGA
jgi:methylenetetrahydrofolate dehydrogenase (NADP+)/methenyltetrahydrofolate cyclohydrolase